VAALLEWLAGASIMAGVVFRSIRQGKVGHKHSVPESAIAQQGQVGRTIKARAWSFALPP
jgi:hypothetical protein